MSMKEPEPVDVITMARWVGRICQVIGTVFAALGVLGCILLLANLGDDGTTAEELVATIGITWVGFLSTAAAAALLIGVGVLLRLGSTVLIEIRRNSQPDSTSPE